MTEHVIDLVAASRISRRVDLREIRLTEMRATCEPGVGAMRPLNPVYEHDCVRTDAEDGFIAVSCSYVFRVKSAGTELAAANMTYHILYKVVGDEPTEPSDVEQFARANGAYHSWPFVRETIYSLTAKMGFPPYTLPVLSFLPRPQQSTDASNAAVGDDAEAEITEQ